MVTPVPDGNDRLRKGKCGRSIRTYSKNALCISNISKHIVKALVRDRVPSQGKICIRKLSPCPPLGTPLAEVEHKHFIALFRFHYCLNVLYTRYMTVRTLTFFQKSFRSPHDVSMDS